MPARTSRRCVLLAVSLGCLLVLAGLVPTDDVRGTPGTNAAPSAASGDRVVASRGVTAQLATSGQRVTGRPAVGRAVAGTGLHLAPAGSSGVAQLGERVGSSSDRASSGSGELLAVAPPSVDPPAVTSHPARPQGATAAAVRASLASFPARGPPAA